MVANGNIDSFSIRAAEKWSAEAERWQHRIPYDDPHEFKDHLRRLVEGGVCKLCEIFHRSEKVGVLVFRVEQLETRELVVCALYCAPIPGIDVTERVDEVATALAKDYGCISIRFHTLRPGLVRKCHALGYRTAEIVLRKLI